MQSTCTYAICESRVRSRGLCESHYRKWRRCAISVPWVPEAQVRYNGDLCKASECDRAVAAREFCLMHYKRWRKHGTATPQRKIATRAESFSSRTRHATAPVSRPGLGDCIEWQGALNHGGYGVFTHRASGVKKKLAHRMSLEMDGVELPHGMVVDHLCRNRKCVNPHHLEVVTNEENLRRGAGYRLRNGMDNSCINGHEYTLKNTYSNPNKPGDIRCMECARTRDRERSRKKAS